MSWWRLCRRRRGGARFKGILGKHEELGEGRGGAYEAMWREEGTSGGYIGELWAECKRGL